MSDARVVRVSGSLAEARPFGGAGLYELVRVGRKGLLGEVIRVDGDTAVVQVFEETSGLSLGEPVGSTGRVLRAELGPGLLDSVLDGVGRPLPVLAEIGGEFLLPGASAPTLDPDRRWSFDARRTAGEVVRGGDVLGTVPEGELEHRILAPPGISGRIAELGSGDYGVRDEVGRLEDGTPLRLGHRWPVRVPRPVRGRLPIDRPFLTGQRVLDFLLPVGEGGAVAVPGGFGTGKTVIEQSLARHGAADVVVFVGCGERGNEMAEMLEEFPRLEDPRTGRPLMERTVLVVNTSNMPVVAREASIYLGITVGEYYRDMGYRVAVMADSLSRWAEALREIGSRLGAMPGEEGYPTHLSSRLGRVYERAGRVACPGDREGALTFISAVSPPGGDFSEPVTQASLRVAGALWALDASLAHQRQYPAVDWETSYSLYTASTDAWFEDEVDPSWPETRRRVYSVLERGGELRDIAALVGAEALEDQDRLALETARTLREVFLGQNAFDPVDAFCPAAKTHRLAELILRFHDLAASALRDGAAYGELDLAAARTALQSVRDAPVEELEARAEAAATRLEEAVAAGEEGAAAGEEGT